TSGVDPLTRREFWDRIGGLADAGVTVLVTSHFMDEAEYCDRLAVIYRGRLIALGTPDAIKAGAVDAMTPEPTLDDAFVALIADYDRGLPRWRAGFPCGGCSACCARRRCRSSAPPRRSRSPSCCRSCCCCSTASASRSMPTTCRSASSSRTRAARPPACGRASPT